VRTARKIRRVLVGLKELRAAPALNKAAHIADKCGAELVLFHDLATPVFVEGLGPKNSMRAVMREGRRAALAGLEKLAAPLRARGLKVSIVTEWDYPAHEAIIRAAQHARADLIVVQARARHRFASLLGYTDWSLLRDSPLPVLLVKTSRPYRRPRLLAAVDPAHAFAKPADLDAAIIREAGALAANLGSAMHVVHAYAPPSAAVIEDMAALAIQTLDARTHDVAKRALRKVLSDHSIPPARGHLVRANPVDAIARMAREIEAGIVVMGAISRRGLRRLFIGNTAERLLDEIPCDLLVVKPAKFAPRLPRGRRGASLMFAPPPIG
jgi:universal stress protein E